MKINELWGKEVGGVQPIKTLNGIKIRKETWRIEGRIFVRKSFHNNPLVWEWSERDRPAANKLLEDKRTGYVLWHRQKQREVLGSRYL